MNKIIAVLLYLTAIVAGAATPSVVERPDVMVGDEWTYQSTDGFTGNERGRSTLRVGIVGEDEIQISSTLKNGGTVNILETRDMNTISRWPNKGNVKRYIPHSGRLVFPIVVGSTWRSKNAFEIGALRRGTEDLEATVVGWEEVYLPCGMFNAVKITWTGFYNSTEGSQSGSGRVETTMWYAPKVKRSVKSVYKEWDWNGRLSTWTVTELLHHRVGN